MLILKELQNLVVVFLILGLGTTTTQNESLVVMVLNQALDGLSWLGMHGYLEL
ncbi:hypothetical protein ACG2LH_15870 [Zhouia sp. PK063]|uniref:hypothetical protein n=1 Tax=Zhouia sp. PK063 TaxID=3373602 RepID=UPI0037B768CE